MGYQVVNAEDTNDCLNKIDSEKDLSLLLTDIRMPSGSGFDLILKVREKRPKMPVVIITGYQTEKLNEFIEKNDVQCSDQPFSILEFDKEVKKQ